MEQLEKAKVELETINEEELGETQVSVRLANGSRVVEGLKHDYLRTHT